MKQLFLDVNNGAVQIIESPAPAVKDNTVIVETLYSVISAGTERVLTSFGGKNLIQKALERPDQVKKVLEKISTDGLWATVETAFNRLKEPMPMGYSAVGKVKECGKGVTEVHPGDFVALVGQAYHAEVNRVNKNLISKIPSTVDDKRQFSFGALGCIALQGIHQADVVPGETVAIIGLGLLGHITARILNAYGCDVIGYDIIDKSLQDTRLLSFIRSDDDNAESITKSLTKGRGVDKVIITAASDSNGPMDLAATITRDRGTICMIGVTQMNIDRRPYYEKELSFVIARSYGPGRYDVNYEEKGIDYPVGYIRFTEGRNLDEFIRLITEHRVCFIDLITHVIDFDEAGKAYELITAKHSNEQYIGILLKYSENSQKWSSTVENHNVKVANRKQKLFVGLIGAGNFAKNTMLPIMKSTGLYHFKGLATTGGINSAQAKSITDFDYMTSDYSKLLNDADIDLIIVSTQHDSHAKFVVEALNAGKNVYCEKPLCLTLEELERIETEYRVSNGELFCGLNRRYAPLIKEIKQQLTTDSSPAIYNYIVNAGAISSSHWTQDEILNGGRILGEAIHFIDTIQFLDGSRIKRIEIDYLRGCAYSSKDSSVILVSFESGAICSIIYAATGSKRYPKEQLRVFSNGSIYELDNYMRLRKYGNLKSATIKLKQDKGIRNEYINIYSVLGSTSEMTTYSTEEVFDLHRQLIEAIH